MRKYSKDYLDTLKNSCTEIENHGVKIILKPSPGEKRSGYLDPSEKAVFENMDKIISAGRQAEEPEKIEDNAAPTLQSIVSGIRKFMGFPNLNLNTTEIYTKFETINSSGNEVGIWRYYPRWIEDKKNKAALVFIHGGGWIGGTTYVVENFCKLIAERANCVVFNIDYSLAPEKPFPNGLNDNFHAVKHIYDNAEGYGINKNKIALAGDSAGGNYTAAVSLMARDLNIPMVAMQILIYPAIALGDATVPGYIWSEDIFEVAEEQKFIINGLLGLGKPRKLEEDILENCYLPNSEDVYNQYVSPIMAKTHENLPKAILVGAEFDGLRIHTEFYAKQLKEAGVDVTCYRYKGMSHAFIDRLGYVPQAEDLVDVISDAIREL